MQQSILSDGYEQSDLFQVTPRSDDSMNKTRDWDDDLDCDVADLDDENPGLKAKLSRINLANCQ